MVLPIQSLDYFLPLLTKSPEDYRVFKFTHLLYTEDKQRAEIAMECVMYAHAITMANKMYSKIGVDTQINSDIILKASKAVLNDESFTDQELIEFYTTIEQMEKFEDSIQSFSEQDLFLPYELNFILLGVPLKQQLRSGKDKIEKMHEKFGDIRCGIDGIKGFVKPTIEEEVKQGKRVAKEYNSND